MYFRFSIVPVCFLLFSIGYITACSTDENRSLSLDIEAEDLEMHIRWLADPELEGRLAGTRHEARAANYIADYFMQFGLEPGGDDDTYLQSFTLEGPVTQAMGVEGHLSRNVIGIVPGLQETDTYIVVGAHFDSQGMGGVISLDTSDESVVHPGADDNASGTAGLLELAHFFSQFQPNRTLVFVAFSGEELGLLGSRYFTDSSILPSGEIIAMVNLDMIGRMEDNRLSVLGTGTASVWPDLIDSSNLDTLEISQIARGTGASDHASFYEKGIPVLHYFTGTHEDYHRPGDTADKINYEGTTRVVLHAKRVIAGLDTLAVEELEFIAGNRQQQHRPMQGPMLGVMPDYSFDGSGLKIENVRSGDPGDEAGMADGDIIVEMNGESVTDIYGYMELIGKYNYGDRVEFLIVRNGEELLLEVQF